MQFIVILSFIVLFMLIYLLRRITTRDADTEPVCYSPDWIDFAIGVSLILLSVLCCGFCQEGAENVMEASGGRIFASPMSNVSATSDNVAENPLFSAPNKSPFPSSIGGPLK